MVAKIRTSGTKGITSSKLPHSSQQLSKTSHGQSHSDDGVRDDDASSLNVEEGEDEGRGSERVETTVIDDERTRQTRQHSAQQPETR